jgi:hypothetical protein
MYMYIYIPTMYVQGLSFLEAMAEVNAMPDVITFNNLIAACAQVCDKKFCVCFLGCLVCM